MKDIEEPVKLLKQLYIQVLIGIILGVALGLVAPDAALRMKPLGDAFIALLRMMLGPIIFCSVVLGLTHVADMRQLGRLAGKSLLYFEVLTTLAMAIGMVAVNIFEPGVGLHAGDLPVSDAVVSASKAMGEFSAVDFLLNIIPRTMVDAFGRGEILQVLFVSVLVGTALSVGGVSRESILLRGIDEGQTILFRILGVIMRMAPVGAFGAIAHAVGTHGGGTLVTLLNFILVLYACAALFIIVVLGGVLALCGLSLAKVLRVVRAEILITFGSASVEAVLPRLIQRCEEAGCDRSIAGFVIPAGTSFNLDGTSLYMGIAVGFLAQATDTPFSIGQQMAVLAVMLLTSKGGTAVAGGAFVKLAGTLQTVQSLPLSGLGLLLGIDRVNATCIAVTNLIGNTVATFVLAVWENQFDRDQFERYLAAQDSGVEPAAVVPAKEERV
jgi:aerobic C4-dicarboxylate transport protein